MLFYLSYSVIRSHNDLSSYLFKLQFLNNFKISIKIPKSYELV